MDVDVEVDVEVDVDVDVVAGLIRVYFGLIALHNSPSRNAPH